MPATTIFNLRPDTPNIGNELIAAATETMLRSALGEGLTLVSLPARANGGLKGGGLTSQMVYEINQLADGVLIGPGNLFENGALTVDPGALCALRVPAMVFSVSRGRVFDRTGELVSRTDSVSEDKIRAIYRSIASMCVRDNATKNHLAELGCDRVSVVGCPTLFINEARRAIAPVDPALAHTVLVSIRHPKLMSIPYSAHGRVQRELRRIIDHFHGQGFAVSLLCHDYQDLPYAQTFADVPALYTEDPWRFLSWLRSCKLSVGFRLHAFICCLALGIPSIPLTYDERSMSLIETVGMGDWSIPFLHSEDVLAEVQARTDSLRCFEELKSRARPKWESLRKATVYALERFGSEMESRARTRVL